MIRKTRWHKAGALMLSAAMGLSSFSAALPGGVVYAENGDVLEADTEASAETSTGGSEVGSDNASVSATEEISATEDSQNTDAAPLEATDESSKESEETDTDSASKGQDAEKESEPEEASTLPGEEKTSDRNFDSSKVDVWDFGAENLGDAYNNRLDVDTINGFYSVAAGSTGVNIAAFSVDDGDFVFEDGGYATTHRLRTTNTSLTRYDEKSLKNSDGNVFSGYLYSNKSATEDVYVALECKTDDVITAYVASNGTDSTVHFKNTKDASDDTSMLHNLGGSTVTKMTFYPSQDSQYKIYSATEKLVLARVLREHAQYGYLTGSVEGYEGTGSFDIVFTNVQNGNVVKATVADGKFTAQLAEGFDYTMSLAGADDYAITSDKTVNISSDTEMNVTVEGVELVEVSGKLTGIADEDMAKFVSAAEFKFVAQDEKSVYVPEIALTLTDSAIEYDVKLQKDVTYAVSVADKKSSATEKYVGVEDYNLVTTELTVAESADDFAIEFEAKPVYKVTIVPNGATLADLKDAVFTFTRLDAEKEFAADGYVYEFTGTDDIALRDGQ